MSGQAAVQISRGALVALSAGASTLFLYVNGVGPPGLQPTGTGLMTPRTGQQDAMVAQMDAMMSELARLRVQTQYGSQYGGWGISWTTIGTVGGVGLLVLYIRGYSWADVMYVTRAALSSAVEALEEGIESLGGALETAKRELTYKMGLIEDRVDAAKNDLDKKISDEVGDVKRDLVDVASDVKGISFAQGQVHGLVQNIETQIDTIEAKMENANSALTNANRGIYLLCNVVADNMAAASAKGSGRAHQSSGSLYEELVAYTRSAVSSFSRSTSAPAPAPAPAPPSHASLPAPSSRAPLPAPAPASLPTGDHGLRLLEQQQQQQPRVEIIDSPQRTTPRRSVVGDMLERSQSFSNNNSNNAGQSPSIVEEMLKRSFTFAGEDPRHAENK